jgi:hypothetical protein
MGDTFFGVRIASLSEQVRGIKGLGVAVTVENPRKVKLLEESFDKFEDYYRKFFKDIVIETHKYLLRVTPLHTGKLRGGWTAFLDKYQIDYSKQMYDQSLYSSWKGSNKTPEHRVYNVDSAAVEKGKSFSVVSDNLKKFIVVLTNKVPYSEHLNYGTSTIPGRHYLTQTKYKSDFWYKKYMKVWIKSMSKSGIIAPPPKIDEIPN